MEYLGAAIHDQRRSAQQVWRIVALDDRPFRLAILAVLANPQNDTRLLAMFTI